MPSPTITALLKKFNLFPVKGKNPDTEKIKAHSGAYSWSYYRTNKIDKYYLKGSKFGVCTGVDGLEVLDIDNHFDDATHWLEYIKDNFDLSGFPVLQTGGGGYHIYYRSPGNIEGNKKLASKRNLKLKDEKNPNGKWDAFYETRGTGGYVVFYNNVVAGDILNVPEITKEQRQTLIEICQSADEKIKEEHNEPSGAAKFETVGDGEKPGEKYNKDSSSIAETRALLESAGWKNTSKGQWRRPGKKDGISATFGKTKSDNKFYCFTSNADPFEVSTSYTMFGVRAMLLHNGDFGKCAKELAEKYGMASKPRTSKPRSKQTNTDAIDATDAEMMNPKWRALIEIVADWSLKIRFNTLTKTLDYKFNGAKGFEDDIDVLVSDIIYEMENERGIKSISGAKVKEMLMSSKIMDVYNPLTEWLKSLPKWDGKTDHIAKLCEFIKLPADEDRVFFDEMMKKHLVRTLRTATTEKYVNRIVLTIHGPQEIGKSKFWEWLTPDDLYFDEQIDLKDKDNFIALGRHLIMNFDDLDQLNKKDVSKLKAFISKSSVNKRIPYGRAEMRMPRIASFVGTTNVMDILTDDSNTRWLILKVLEYDYLGYMDAVKPADIWAQAMALMQQGTQVGELTTEEKGKREMRNNKEFLETSQEREILAKWYREVNYPDGTEGMTLSEVNMEITNNLLPYKPNEHNLRRELRRLFGESKRTSVRGVPGRYYYIESLFPRKLNEGMQPEQSEKMDDKMPF